MVKEKLEIVLNRVKCNNCHEVITSYSRYDYVTCSCGNAIVDGGRDYLRRLGKYTDMSIWSDAPFEVIRENYHWGTYGKNGNEPLKYVPVSEMTDEHILAIIETQHHAASFMVLVLNQELLYRAKNNI